jgi:AAHS family 4-hydroxybenzoate transporter-like MFS transporter
MMAGRGEPMDELLNAERIRWRQIAIALLCVLVLTIDGVDYSLLSYVGPLIIADFQIDKVALGSALSAALIGMAIGAIVGGAVGDRIGRKPAIALATAFFGLTTMATAYVDGLGPLIALRLVSGLGFGIAFPNALALSAEWMPVRFRTITVAMGTVGSAFGGVVGAAIAAIVVPLGGWRGCFQYSGAFTIGLAALLALVLLESPDYLHKQGRSDRLRKVLQSAFGNVVAVGAERPAFVRPTVPKATILTRACLRTNLSLWLAAIGYSVASFGTYSWTTTILVSTGLSLNRALVGASAYSSLALVGPFVCGTLASFTSSRAILFGLLALWIAATLGLLAALLVQADPMLFYLCLAVIGFCAGSYAAVLYAAAALLYDPAARATGIGATIGVTRIGGILSAAVGGALLTVDPSFRAFYAGMALLLAASMLGVLFLPRTGREGEDEAPSSDHPSP